MSSRRMTYESAAFVRTSKQWKTSRGSLNLHYIEYDWYLAGRS